MGPEEMISIGLKLAAAIAEDLGLDKALTMQSAVKNLPALLPNPPDEKSDYSEAIAAALVPHGVTP